VLPGGADRAHAGRERPGFLRPQGYALTAVYGRARWDLRIPDCRSLKDKRRIVHGLRDRARARLKVSAAETSFQEDPQRAEVSIAFVSSDATLARTILDRADALIASDPRVYILETESEIF